MDFLLLAILAIIVSMLLLAGQTYVTPKFSQIASAQASYAGNVGVTAAFIFLALIIAGFVMHLVDSKLPGTPTA
jgi:hypothetical protein